MRYPPPTFPIIYSTHFTINITNSGDSLPSHSVAGRVKGIYTSLALSERVDPVRYRSVAVSALNPDPVVLDSLQRKYLRVGFVNDLPLEITTNDDTTNLEQTLKYFLPRALRASHLAIYRVSDPEPGYKELAIYPNAKVNYGYLGKDQDSSTFRLTYSGHGAGTTSEVVVKSDVSDRINRELVGMSLIFKDTINGNSYYVKVKTRTVTVIRCEFPVELEYCIKDSDGTVVNITINNIDYRDLWGAMKIPRELQWRELQYYRDAPTYRYYEIELYLERMVYDEKRREKKRATHTH